MKNLQEKTKAAVFWSIGGTLLINLFQLLFIGILARSLDATDFGLYTASLVTLSFVRIISEIGIGPAIVQCPQITPRHIQTSVTISLSLSTMAAIILGSSAFIWSAFFHDPKIKEIIILLAFGLPIRGIAVVCESLLIREMRFKAYSTIQFFAYSIGFGVVAITLAHYNFGVWSLAVANLCQVIFVTIAALLLVWRPLGFGFGFGFGLKEGKELLNYGFGNSLAAIAAFFADQGSNIIAGRYLGPVSLGYYSRAYQLLVAPAKLLGSQVGKALFPALAKVQEDTLKIKNIIIGGVNIISLCTIPLSVFCIITAHEIITLILGKNWEPVIVPFQILCASLVLRSSYRLFDSMAKAVGAVYRRAWRQWIYSAAVFLMSFVGSHWGIDGLALGMAGAMLFNFALMLNLFCNHVSLSFSRALAAYKPGIIIGLLLFGLNFPLSILLRSYFFSAFSHLSICAAISIVFVAVFFRLFPSAILYGEGLRIFERLMPPSMQMLIPLTLR